MGGHLGPRIDSLKSLMSDEVLNPSAIVGDLGAATAAKFVQRVHDRMDELDPQLSAVANHSALADLAHSNKSVAASVGADQLAAAFDQLDSAARQGDDSAITAAIAECRRAVANFREMVPEVLKRLARVGRS